jgi:uncharacterized repeat protein (TIGR01451 family)
MKTNRNILYIGLVAALALALFPCISPAQQMKTLHGHVPAAISRLNLQPAGQLAGNSTLDLAISLQPRNEKGLDDLLNQVYDTSSPNYRHYLTPGQFGNLFSPSAQDYEIVMNFARVHGLTVVGTDSNHMVLDVRGRVSDIEKAFQVSLRTYHHPKENRDFYAPDRDPAVTAALPVFHVTGLDNYVIPHPLLHQMAAKPANAKPSLGSGPGGGYMGKDFRAAYAPGVALDGTGQSVGLFELDGYFTADIVAYEAQAGLPNITLTNISVNGGVGTPGFGDSEVSLDIEMDVSMATNASQVIVYEAPNGAQNSPVDLLNRIASDDITKEISSSWGIGDNPAYDIFYKQMALQGQSFFQASGDDGAYYSNDEGVEQFADDTNITLVGGTTLSTTGPQGLWSSETTWSWFVEQIGESASGGGTNYNGIPIPSWQQGISMTNNMGSTTLRNVPDVALTADNIYVIFDDGNAGSFGGTSCAAPLWAAFTALANQQAVADGQPTVGFLNPAIYTIGKSAIYTNCFHDISTGNNTNFVVGNAYFAAPGYDLCTGWGTPTGSNLINALISVPTTNVFTHLSAPLPPYGTNMAALNGSNPNGNWYLFVQDYATFNSGLISNGWVVALTTANPIGAVADDDLTMSASPTNLLTGSSTTVSINIENVGPSVSSNVVVSDALPLGFTVLSSSATMGSIGSDGQTVTWNVSSNLAVSASAQATLTLEAGSAGTAINSASVSSVTPDQNPADGSASVTFNVTASAPPSLSASLGTGGKFKLTVSGVGVQTIVQASTNLINWVNISTNTPPFIFTDTVSAQFPYRFYRAELQPAD